MTAPARRSGFGSLIATGLLGLMVWIGGREWLAIIAKGWLRGRRGPGVSAVDDPLLFWAMVVFIGAGLVLAIGLTGICALDAVRTITRNRRTH